MSGECLACRLLLFGFYCVLSSAGERRSSIAVFGALGRTTLIPLDRAPASRAFLSDRSARKSTVGGGSFPEGGNFLPKIGIEAELVL
jgi:hypothetical protein